MGRKSFDRCGKDREPMTSAVFVKRARTWAEWLEDREAERASSRPMARDAVERRHRLPSGILYSLRYRPPKRIAADVYEALRAALIAACEREQERLEHQIAVARAAGMDVDHPALRAAEAAARPPED